MSAHPFRSAMPPPPIDEPDVVALVRARGLLLDGAHRGQLTVELDWADGHWSLGNVCIKFSRGRMLQRSS